MPYTTGRDQGWISTFPSAMNDHDAMAAALIALAERYGWRVRGIGVDQAGANAFINKLRAHYGEELVTEVPQGFRMLSGPSKTLEALVLNDHLAHDGNPVMTMCVGNMGKDENSWRDIRPVKLRQRGRIDGGVALIDAICTMERTPADDGGGTSVYETRGLASFGG